MANLYFEAQLDAEQLKRELRELNNRLNGFAQNAKTQGDEIDQVFKRIGQAAAGYFTLTGGKEFIGQLINVRGEFQQLDIALETMLRNKSASNKLTAEVVQLAAKTPYSLTELGKGAKQLIAFKEPADKVADTLRRIGDISAGVSAPVGDLVSAYGKVSAKGKMQAEELNQFAERGVPIISELAKVIGTTDDKIYKMAEDGKIGFKELQQAIMNMTNEGGQFANMMEKQAGSLTGLVSNLGDAWDRMLNDIGQSNQGLLADGIKGLTSLVDNYEEVLKVLGLIVGTYGAYKAAIVAVSMAQKVEQVLSMVSAWTGLTKSINSAKNAQMAFNVASRLNPMGLAASAIAALVGGLMLYSSASKKAASASEDVGRAVMAETTKMDALFSIAKNTTISTEARKSAIDEINKVYAPYLENMLTEKSTLEEIEKAQRNATNALIADVGVKRSKDKLAAALDQFSEDQDKLLSGFLSDLVDVSGAGVQSAFMSELNKLVDYANQYGLMGANGYSLAYRRFYDTFAKQVAQSTGFMEYSEHDIAVMVQNIADKRKVLDDETKKIQGLIDAYSALTSGKKTKTVDGGDSGDNGGGDSDGRFDEKEYEKYLKEQKNKYDDYETIKAQLGEKAAKSAYPNMLADYQAFLEDQLKMYLNNTNAKVAIAKTAEQTGLSINMGKLAPKGRSSTTVKKPVSSQLIDMSPYLDELQKKAKELSESIFDEKSNKRLISFANGVQDIANKLNEIDPEVGNVVMGFADMAGVIGTIGANFKKADGVWKNMSFEDKFSAISMVASITIGTLNKIVTAAKEAKAEEEEYVRAMIQLQNDYNISLNETLRLRSDGKSIFYVDYEAQINDAVAARESAMLELNKQLDNITKKGKWGDKVTQYSWGIATGSKTYWFDLLDKYPQLINAQGEFDKSLAESILKNERLNKDTKQYLENAIAWYDQLEESQKQINDSLESMVGSLGNDLYDALVSSFEAGEDAAQAFGNTVGGIMKNTARQMAFNTIMGPYFDQLEERMKASYDLVSGDMNIIDDLQWFSGIKDTVLPMINDAFKSIDDMVGTTAASMTDPNSLSGAVKGVSEETASIVAGQMNAIRINQAESLKMMNQSVAHMAEVAANTRYNHYLESIDNRLARIETSDPLRAKGL